MAWNAIDMLAIDEFERQTGTRITDDIVKQEAAEEATAAVA
jgi:hypothetical protein